MKKVQVEQFEGPLDLLLQLIERQELDITEVSLAEVTEQYLAILEQEQNIPPEELADFLVVAAKLLFIKSRTLIPSLFAADDEEPEADLTYQLALYRLYVEAGSQLLRAYRSKRTVYARERPLPRHEFLFSPPPLVSSETLRVAMRTVLAELEVFVRPAPEVIRRTISLREKILSLRDLLREAKSLSFTDVLRGAKDRTEVIVTFLALLELIKQRYVIAEQDTTTMIRITTLNDEFVESAS